MKSPWKAVLIAFLLAVYSFTALGCQGDRHSHRRGPKIDGSGTIAREERTIGTFHGVRLEGIGKVFIRQEAEQKIVVEADDNILKDVVTDVSGGVLRVRMRDDRNYGDVKIRVYVSAPTFDEVLLAGAGEIRSDNDLNCERLACSLTGVGDITLSGRCRKQEVSISGVGNISNDRLVSEECKARVSGLGNCEVNVTKELDASVSGMGKITYSGEPANVSKDVSGMGTVNKR
jgi:hypothetical protein